MGTSIGAAIDYLLTGLTPKVAAVMPEAEVADCWTSTDTDSYVVVGRLDPDSTDAATSDVRYDSVGATRVQESYTIPICIETVRDGPAHKPARDAALALLDVIVAFLHADPTLGGLLTMGRIAEIQTVELHQTLAADAVDAGRRATVQIRIGVENTITF